MSRLIECAIRKQYRHAVDYAYVNGLLSPMHCYVYKSVEGVGGPDASMFQAGSNTDLGSWESGQILALKLTGQARGAPTAVP